MKRLTRRTFGAAALAPLAAHLQGAADAPLPPVWSTYRRVVSLEADFEDLKRHGVDLVSIDSRSVEDAKRYLEVARRFGMQYHIGAGDMTESAPNIRRQGLEVVDALMVGGVYDGKAMDRHLFRFSAGKHEIVIEPPVYNKAFAYTLGTGSTGQQAAGDRIAHYFPDMPDPVRAEVVVPLKAFDGKQHLRIVPAKITTAPAGAKPANDSVTPDMPSSAETRNRKLYTVSFDLGGLGGAMLDRVSIAVYWPYHGTDKYWLFGRGTASAAAESTRKAARKAARDTVQTWIDANGGKFPSDVVRVIRFGDECFYVTSHISSANDAVNYPLWDFSEPQIARFRRHAGTGTDYPRTWGFPEIYGESAYGWWMYALHESCAELMGAMRDEVHSMAPGLLTMRNTTRAGVFDLSNDRDGSGAELLTRNLDIAHLDPYPVHGTGYQRNIPRDMAYYGGLARRYKRPLVPWMQAHTYGGPQGLQDVTPEQIDRMAQEQWQQGPDAIMWLGYGNTFPKVRPDSWERAGEFHKRLKAARPPKPQARLAVVRGYDKWALTSVANGKVRNPTDWMLQQWLEVWAVEHGQPYDVFEVPPGTVNAPAEVKQYAYVVSTVALPGAWVIRAEQPEISADGAAAIRKQMGAEMIRRGWLKK